MLQATMPELKNMLRFVAIKHRKPVFIWGKPGIGKSECVQQLASEFNATEENNGYVDVRLGQYDSVDLRGIPVPDAETDMTVWNLPSTLPFVGNPNFNSKAKAIFLFLDEMNGASNAVLGVTYQLLQNRRVGEHKLMDNVVMICAGNRETDRGVTTRMPTPVANRLIHVELIEDVDAVCIHFQDIQLPQIGVAFLQFRKPLLSTFDPTKTDKAFATPRAWETALRFFADKEMDEKSKLLSVAGTVGPGPAHEFFGFVDVWHKIIPISRIMADPDGTPIPAEESMRYATAVNISGELTPKNVGKLHRYLSRFEATYAILAWHLAVKRDKTLFNTKEFLDFSQKYKAVFA